MRQYGLTDNLTKSNLDQGKLILEKNTRTDTGVITVSVQVLKTAFETRFYAFSTSMTSLENSDPSNTN